MQLLHGIDWSGPHKATSRWPACVDDDFAPACLESYQHNTWASQTRPSAGGVILGPFSFGHPSVESVANRLFNNNTLPPNDNSHLLIEAHEKERISEIIQNYEASRQLDEAKEKQKIIDQQASGRETNLWWEAPIEQLNLQPQEDLDSRYTKHINELYDTISKKVAATTDAN
ncbi:hypothetical protein V6N13_027116 [Hibiscus sabdariffa]|uniref:Uncharacterized protein n=1 Tax=Hibiscus sabdariffa TaxID=183260 RepID=A0ABR1ZP85_9ROSI